MQSLVRSAPLATRPEPTYKSEKVVQTTGATSTFTSRVQQILDIARRILHLEAPSAFHQTTNPGFSRSPEIHP